MRCYTQKYRFPSKTAKGNQKKNVVLNCKKKRFFLRKLTKTSKLILCFSEILKFFICVRVI